MSNVRLVNARYESVPDMFNISSIKHIKMFVRFTCYWELTDKDGRKYIDKEEITDQESVHDYASLISYAKEDLQ